MGEAENEGSEKKEFKLCESHFLQVREYQSRLGCFLRKKLLIES